MPLYEYQCPSCGDLFEFLQRGQQQPPTCPACGGSQCERQLSAPAGHVRSGQLPVSEGCGRPECGMGGCQGW
jgi:putative FmdB family regulatory protein